MKGALRGKVRIARAGSTWYMDREPRPRPPQCGGGNSREALGSSRLWQAPTMKNFGRLVWFAWSYRLRFGLSLVCAALVALLWVANISTVYPLLRILLNESENCQ